MYLSPLRHSHLSSVCSDQFRISWVFHPALIFRQFCGSSECWIPSCFIYLRQKCSLFSTALPCTLNCSLSLKQTIWKQEWHRFTLEPSSSHGLAVSDAALTSLSLPPFLLISSPCTPDFLKKIVHVSCLMMLFESLFWRPVIWIKVQMTRSEGCMYENAEITIETGCEGLVLLLAQQYCTTGPALSGGWVSPLRLHSSRGHFWG